MKIIEIHYSSDFQKKYRVLSKILKKKAQKTELVFRKNPFHPSLRLHKLKGKLKGLWSISVDRRYRIIFEPMDKGKILFISIGIHSLYDKDF